MSAVAEKGWRPMHEVLREASQEETDEAARLRHFEDQRLAAEVEERRKTGRVEERRPFECVLCGERLETQEYLTVHRHFSHKLALSGQGIRCGIESCPRVFETNGQAGKHRRSEHGVSSDQAKEMALPRGDIARHQQDKKAVLERSDEPEKVPSKSAARPEVNVPAQASEQVHGSDSAPSSEETKTEPLILADGNEQLTATAGRTLLWEEAEARYDRAVFGFRALYIRELFEHAFEHCGKGNTAPHMSVDTLERIERLLWTY